MTWLEKEMGEWYEIETRGGLDGVTPGMQEMTILNREINWNGHNLSYQADPKHVQIMAKEFGLDDLSKGLEVPITRDVDNEEDAEDELQGEEATQYRALAARANYLSQDRVDIQFAAKEACRGMSKPKRKDHRKLKRLARYLIQHPRLTYEFQSRFRDDDLHVHLDVYTDSDWAGCKESRKSTSGGVVMFEGSVVKTWSSTQATVAQSSGEAEYYALVKAACEALGVQSLLRDMGKTATITLWIDSSAAKGIASRTGLGKMRHLEVKFLWVQESLKKKRFVIRKIGGKDNCADVLTKPQSLTQMKDLLDIMDANIIHREAANDRRVDHIAARRVEPERVAKARWADDDVEDEDMCEVEKILGYAWRSAVLDGD